MIGSRVEFASVVAAAALVVVASLAGRRAAGDPDAVRPVSGIPTRAEAGPADEPRSPSEVAPYVESKDRLVRLLRESERGRELGGLSFTVSSAPDGGYIAVSGDRVSFLDASLVVRAEHQLGARSVARPAVAADGTAYVGTQGQRLVAIAPDGRRRWSYRAGADLDASPAVGADGAVFVAGDDGRLLALEADGRLRFGVDIGSPIRGALGVTSDGLVVAATMGPRPRVVGLDARTGARRFVHVSAFTDGDDEGFAAGVVIDAQGRILAAGDEERIVVLSTDGRMLRSVRTDCPLAFAPLLLPDGSQVHRCASGGAVRIVH